MPGHRPGIDHIFFSSFTSNRLSLRPAIGDIRSYLHATVARCRMHGLLRDGTNQEPHFLDESDILVSGSRRMELEIESPARAGDSRGNQAQSLDRRRPPPLPLFGLGLVFLALGIWRMGSERG